MSTTHEHPAQAVPSTVPHDPAGSSHPGALQAELESPEGPESVDIPASPEQLRALAAGDLPGLARTLRRQLVAVTSRTGGHLGPNLGVVELTIALHRELRSPHEAIVFDTGHQAYVHKMLTGRGDLEGLRTADGLSGYPDRGESDHDVVENSHASGSIAWAHGIEKARRLAGETGVSAAVIGDGALTGGVGLEALNVVASDIGSRTIVVLNDNTRSYAPTIGGLARHLQALRDRSVPAGADMFTALGLTYLGPIDGHDHEALATALAQARAAAEDPARAGVVVHVVTRKGAGFERAENDVLDHWHATGPFEIEPASEPEVVQGADAIAPRETWTSRFGAAVLQAARADERVVALSAAMVDPVGLTPMQRELPARVIDVGIAEQLALDTAAGLSRGGARPVVALYATFLNRAFDQLLLDIALHGEDVTITLDRAGVTGDDGPSHHGIWDLAVAAQVPGLQVWAPRDASRLDEAMTAALAVEGPSMVRFPKGACPAELSALATRDVGEVLAGDIDSEIDVLILSIGALADRAVAAAELLAGSPGAAGSANVVVLDPVRALPLSTDLLELAARVRAVVTLEDGVGSRGVGAALAQQLGQRASVNTPAPPVRTLGISQEFIPHAKRDAILAAQGLDADGIARSVEDILR